MRYSTLKAIVVLDKNRKNQEIEFNRNAINVFLSVVQNDDIWIE